MGPFRLKDLMLKNEMKHMVSLRKIVKEIGFVFFDFDGVFTNNRVLVLEDGTEGVMCSRADGLGLEGLRKLGIEAMVLSKEVNPIVSTRCKKMSISCIQGCNDKVKVLRIEAKNRGIDLKNVAYLGNDINDVDSMKIVGLPACVADAYPSVMAVAQYVTKTPGGHGAVREFCDLIIEAREDKRFR